MGLSGSLALSLAELDIAKVLMCGQSFRWRVEGDEHLGVFAGRLWGLKQTPTHLHYRVLLPKSGDGEDDDVEPCLRRYFQLDVSLPPLYATWAKKDPKFAGLGDEWGGIRILAQDPIETIFAFICSSNNHIGRISSMVEKLARFYGDVIGVWDDRTYYNFPRVEALVGVEAKLRSEAFGYRAGYISATAQKIVDSGGVSWVEGLRGKDYEDARAQLQTLTGVGRKVADCICLMSLGFPATIPVDTHIHQVAKTYLPHLTKAKTLNDKVYSEITTFFKELYGPYAGWAHSVLFASTLRHLQTEKNNKTDLEKKKTPATKKPSPESHQETTDTQLQAPQKKRNRTKR